MNVPMEGVRRTLGLAGALAGLACLMAAGVCVRGVLVPWMEAPAALTRADQERLEHTAATSVFGELRGGVADYLWMKADRLLHNGVELRALTPIEKQDSQRFHASEAPGREGSGVTRHEESETTVVPNREADSRGLLGDVEREIKPYMDMRHHTHRDTRETAALFRLMTWANPRFVPGWVVGADVLAGAMRRPQEALAFLREGAAQNPDSLEIQTELGRYLLTRYHDSRSSERHFLRAIALGAARKRLSEDETDAWENAHRWLVIQYCRTDRWRAARSLAAISVRRFPQTRYFQRVLKRRELLAGVTAPHS